MLHVLFHSVFLLLVGIQPSSFDLVKNVDYEKGFFLLVQISLFQFHGIVLRFQPLHFLIYSRPLTFLLYVYPNSLNLPFS